MNAPKDSNNQWPGKPAAVSKTVNVGRAPEPRGGIIGSRPLIPDLPASVDRKTKQLIRQVS
jgi:hypothetical protein